MRFEQTCAARSFRSDAIDIRRQLRVTSFQCFGRSDAVNILEVVLKVLNGVKRYDALWVRTICRLGIVEGLNMALDVLLPAKSIEKLIESLRCRQI